MATLIAPSNHSPQEDAEALRDAVKGWGTDEKAVIAILCHRNAYQRQQIRKAYQDLHGEDLIKRLESELSGDFERGMYRWILEPAERYALLANVVIRNANKDYHVIVEISCVLEPEELLAVKRAYQNRYKHSLEEDVAAHTSGHLRQLLVGLVSTFRYGGDEINARLAKNEADILHEAIKDKKNNHEEVIRVLSTRSKTQLVATFNRYRDEHGISITKKLLDEGSDDFLKAVHVAIRCINDHKKYYEKVLRNVIKRVGTDEDGLTRVFVTRAEKDLKDIQELYYKRNSVQLEDAVARETSGDYKRMLLTLLGKH
ncbi:PREDICTED: annexin-like protein RJ4 [Lupinus angustifolius]|uniref:annexin-like protein RJ4 n=1 Tax=Lupinus angustifolius TaxID=3871 RepID=UPI00092EC689|nr:PREDICTED: annexin-like protein RJ4 [Lupinus angustifolius]XP_019449997.1 PREDICTED: annexin-like protein RJ4 [Lupinus angustifolius]